MGCAIRTYIPLLDAIPGEEQIADHGMSYWEATVSGEARRWSNTVAYINPLEIVPVKDFIKARILLSQESDHSIAQLTNKPLVPPRFRVHYNADLYQAPVLQAPRGVVGKELILERGLEIIYAPGHAPHQIVILDRKVEGLFCAEALGLPWHHMPAVDPRFDLETYLETIEKLRLLDTRMLFVSHGGLELEPEKIIARAAESAVVRRDIILSDLKQGMNPEATRNSIADYVTRSTGLQLTETDLLVIIGGYTMAFHRMGLV